MPRNRSLAKRIQRKPNHPFWSKNENIIHNDSSEFTGLRYSEQNDAANGNFAEFSRKSYISAGAFGQVYALKTYTVDYELKTLTYRKDDTPTIVKVIRFRDDWDKKVIRREYKIARRLDYLGMREPIFSDNQCYLVMNHLPGKEFLKIYDVIQRLSYRGKLELAMQILQAYKSQLFVHKVVHRNINLKNILIQLSPEIKVHFIDFGLALERGKESRPAGSPCFMAPEAFKSEQTAEVSADLYALGRILSLIFIPRSSEYIQQQFQFKNAGDIDPHIIALNNSWLAAFDLKIANRPELEKFLKSLLHLDAKQRMGLDEALSTVSRLIKEEKEHIYSPLPYLGLYTLPQTNKPDMTEDLSSLELCKMPYF